MLAWPVLDIWPLLDVSNAQRIGRFCQDWLVPSFVPLLGNSTGGVRFLWAAKDILERKCARLPGYVQQQKGQVQQAAPLKQQIKRIQQQRAAAPSSDLDGLLVSQLRRLLAIPINA